LTDLFRVGIEATIRMNKYKQRTATLRKRLREGLWVRIDEDSLDASTESLRTDADTVTKYDGRKRKNAL